MTSAVFPDHLPPAHGEYQAIRQQAGIADISWRGKLKITGPDRAPFLHNMLTNDILNLKEGQGIHTGITTAKAKALGDAWVYSVDNTHFLFTEPHAFEKVYEHLRKYVIASDVQMTDATRDAGMFGIYGPAWKDVLNHLSLEYPDNENLWCKKCLWESVPVFIFSSKYIGIPGAEILVSKGNTGGFWLKLLMAGEAFGAVSVGIPALETIRIESGTPRCGVDFTEEDLFMEAGMEDAVSYTKGCYLGQETIARVKYQGEVRKKITGMEIEGEYPVMPGTKIVAPDDKNKEIGAVTSETYSPTLQKRIALGMLRKEYAEPGTKVVIQANAERHARIHALPFVP